MNRGNGGVAVVVATRDRVESLRVTLDALSRLPSASPIIVVDNGSCDGTVDMVRSDFPQVSLIPLEHNRGAVARNLGVAAADTDLVAFADDDSVWASGSLERAQRLFDSSPGLGLLAARILVGPEKRLDPTCLAMGTSPLGEDGHGRRRVLGFVACGAIVRRRAFSEAGGFERLLFFMGEEAALALDLAARGWDLLYAPEVVAFHRPDLVTRPASFRRRRSIRNRLLSALIHRSWDAVRDDFVRTARRAWDDPASRAGLGEALRKSPQALTRRRPIPARLEAACRLLDDD